MNRLIHISSVMLVVALINACSSGPDSVLPPEIADMDKVTVIPEDQKPEKTLFPERVAEFGDSDEVLIGWIRSVAVDDSGRVFIAGSDQEMIHVFQPDGSFMTSVGREGDGPGEFRGLTQVRTDSLYLYAKDANSLKITRFDLETLEYEDAVRFPFDMDGGGGYTHYLDTFYLIDSLRYLIQYDVGYVVGLEDSGNKPDIEGWVLNRETGEYEDGMIYSFRDSETLYRRTEDNIYVMEPPYMRTSNIMQDREGRMVYGWSEEILFTFHNISGKAVEAIYKPHENVILDPEDVYTIYEDHDDPWKTMIREDDLPAQWPAYGDAAVDDHGRIWVGLFTENLSEYEWIVLDMSGTLSASFRWPRDRDIQLIKDGYIYTLETNPETDVRRIVKYGFDL
jgi:hypothetical protein